MTIQELRNEKNFYKRDNKYLQEKIEKLEKECNFFKDAFKHLQGLVNAMEIKIEEV